MGTYLSKPHFLDCDASVLSKVDGHVRPRRQEHDTFVYIEPHMGSTFLA
jgi:hypothetical protein